MALRDLVARYGIRFKKSLGQNLLLDENINRIMVEAAALSAEDDVIEVGAGLGALTDQLRRRAGRVLAIEIDRAFMPCLEDRFGAVPNVILFRGDVLNHEVEDLVNEYLPQPRTLKVVANLPYYITSPILFHFWESPVRIERMVVMVQEEVAQRMVAAVGTADYGRLTLAAQYYADVDIVHKVPRTCFRPQPRVDSCIVRLRTHAAPPFADIPTRRLMAIAAAAFTHRRKTLRNSLVRSGALGLPASAAEAALESASVDPGRRPQTLTLAEFAAIALEAAKRNPPPNSRTPN
jgi:16S rRNA (adenine1518-N6/adenine1519-N6)-dimethyltransferase